MSLRRGAEGGQGGRRAGDGRAALHSREAPHGEAWCAGGRARAAKRRASRHASCRHRHSCKPAGLRQGAGSSQWVLAGALLLLIVRLRRQRLLHRPAARPRHALQPGQASSGRGARRRARLAGGGAGRSSATTPQCEQACREGVQHGQPAQRRRHARQTGRGTPSGTRWTWLPRPHPAQSGSQKSPTATGGAGGRQGPSGLERGHQLCGASDPMLGQGTTARHSRGRRGGAARLSVPEKARALLRRDLVVIGPVAICRVPGCEIVRGSAVCGPRPAGARAGERRRPCQPSRPPRAFPGRRCMRAGKLAGAGRRAGGSSRAGATHAVLPGGSARQHTATSVSSRAPCQAPRPPRRPPSITGLLGFCDLVLAAHGSGTLP